MSVLDGATPEHWAVVEANRGLVGRHVAQRMRRGVLEVNRDDMYQDGLFGLLRAAMKFDPSKGYTFATYADAWIRQSIDRGIGNLEGGNYRSAVFRRGERWENPASLDAEISHDTTVGDLLAGDGDPAEDALWHVTMTELHEHCRDDLDHDIADLIAAGEQKQVAKPLADRYGRSTWGVQKRQRRLRAVAEQLIEAA